MRKSRRKITSTVLTHDTDSKWNLKPKNIPSELELQKKWKFLTSMTTFPSFSPPASMSKKTLLLPDIVAEDENDSVGLKKIKFDLIEAGKARVEELQEEEARRCRSRRRMLPDCQGCRALGTKYKMQFYPTTSNLFPNYVTYYV